MACTSTERPPEPAPVLIPGDEPAEPADDGVLYLVHACSITSGARLYAVGVGETAWRWQTELYAVGPIAHSAYSNRVDLEWKDGRVVVHGDEAMGRYVEAVDPQTGETLVNKRWPPR